MSAFQRSVQIFDFLHFFFIYRHCDHYVNISNIVIYDIIAYCDNPNTMETVGLFSMETVLLFTFVCVCVCVTAVPDLDPPIDTNLIEFETK